MKKFINSPEDVVSESIEGMIFAHEDFLELHPSARVVMRRDRQKKKVALISGGGSGHKYQQARKLRPGARCGPDRWHTAMPR